MSDTAISQFMELAPQQFTYVIKHDWWNRHPIDEIGIRRDLEIWLCEKPTPMNTKILKIRCFWAQSKEPQPALSQRLEWPVHLGVISMLEQQWEKYHYAFIDTSTGSELFICQRFEAWHSFSIEN